MRACCALYVDAGYLLASAATRVAGTSLRGSVNVNYATLIGALVEQVSAHSGLPLTRVYWYDSGERGGQPDLTQSAIATLPRVKLRLGRLSYAGEQKGVDLRLGLDLVTDAQGPTIDVAYLVSGDDDLTEAVEEAQRHGTNVNVLAVPNTDDRPYGVARHLRQEADELLLIATDTIDGAVHKAGHSAPTTDGAAGDAPGATEPPQATPTFAGPPTPKALAQARPTPATIPKTHLPTVPVPPAPTRRAEPMPRPSTVVYSTVTGQPLAPPPREPLPDEAREAIDEVARRVIGSWVSTASPHERHTLLAGRPQIPPHIDRALLLDLADRLDVDELDDATRVALRGTFWATLDDAPTDRPT